MSDLTRELTRFFVRELRSFEREIEMFPDDELVWKTLPGVTNSAGNLAAHVAGNLQHFVGHLLGKTGYIRNRDLEFSRRSGSRADLVRELRAAIAVVEDVLPRLDDAALARDYPEKLGGVTLTTRVFILHLASHLAHHLGQAGYLRRVLTGQNVSSSPISVRELVERGTV
jgi:uncharacterized damage-inducible protein DinB